MTAEEIARGLKGRKYGTGFMCCCPAHDDKRPSLSVTEKNGRTLFHCFGGCSQESVIQKLRELGLWIPDSLSPEERERRQREREDARRSAIFYSHELDDRKLKALEKGQTREWMALCRVQYQVKKRVGLV